MITLMESNYLMIDVIGWSLQKLKEFSFEYSQRYSLGHFLILESKKKYHVIFGSRLTQRKLNAHLKNLVRLGVIQRKTYIEYRNSGILGFHVGENDSPMIVYSYEKRSIIGLKPKN
jgi:hypothetical protein